MDEKLYDARITSVSLDKKTITLTYEVLGVVESLEVKELTLCYSTERKAEKAFFVFRSIKNKRILNIFDVVDIDNAMIPLANRAPELNQWVIAIGKDEKPHVVRLATKNTWIDDYMTYPFDTFTHWKPAVGGEQK